MDSTILWGSLMIGIALLFFSIKILPFAEWTIAYLLTSYLSIILGVLVVEEKMLDYPVKFLDGHFDSNLLYEYLWLPIAIIYFYRTTYYSRFSGILLQGLVYTSVLTIIEVLIEKNTNIIEYITWTWWYTFVSVFILMVFIRMFMKLYSDRDS
ncbi:CBO0543 family protein [Virgibacillus flavescens]|uniref:CBO0543 family protein n=1 Tax=Virgibacillus flavescens TaxID=1611422 RepID=UPI003D33C902